MEEVVGEAEVEAVHVVVVPQEDFQIVAAVVVVLQEDFQIVAAVVVVHGDFQIVAAVVEEGEAEAKCKP